MLLPSPRNLMTGYRCPALLAISLLLLGIGPARAAEQPVAYRARAITGYVVDAATHKPLKGVIVVVSWGLQDKTGAPVGQLTVREALTDHQGRFHFAAWGPKKVKSADLAQSAPHLLIYKPGYLYQRLINRPVPHKKRKLPLRSDWQGQTITLRKLPPDRVIRAGRRQFSLHSEQINGLIAATHWLYHKHDCAWKKIPRLSKVIYLAANGYAKKGYAGQFAVVHTLIPQAGKADKCGARVHFRP